jgi:hypothetical protein
VRSVFLPVEDIVSAYAVLCCLSGLSCGTATLPACSRQIFCVCCLRRKVSRGFWALLTCVLLSHGELAARSCRAGGQLPPDVLGGSSVRMLWTSVHVRHPAVLVWFIMTLQRYAAAFLVPRFDGRQRGLDILCRAFFLALHQAPYYLSLYCCYIPLLALNGISEAFVAAGMFTSDAPCTSLMQNSSEHRRASQAA